MPRGRDRPQRTPPRRYAALFGKICGRICVAIAETSRPTSGHEDPLQPHTVGEDNLPQALPEILTKSVEELVAAAHNGRQEKTNATVAPETQESGEAKPKISRPAGRRNVLPENIRAGVWIPVTSDKAQT